MNGEKENNSVDIGSTPLAQRRVADLSPLRPGASYLGQPAGCALCAGSAGASPSHWLLGILISFAGVALVRLLGDEHYLLRALGFGLAGLGLLIIAIGVRKRIDHTHDN